MSSHAYAPGLNNQYIFMSHGNNLNVHNLFKQYIVCLSLSQIHISLLLLLLLLLLFSLIYNLFVFVFCI